jgi:hypothetical protein
MNIFDAFERLITEHGSAATLREHLALLRSQMTAKDAEIAKLNGLLKQKDTQIDNLKTEKPADMCPFCRLATGQLQDIQPHPHLGPAGLKVGFYKCSNCDKKYERNMPD